MSLLPSTSSTSPTPTVRVARPTSLPPATDRFVVVEASAWLELSVVITEVIVCVCCSVVNWAICAMKAVSSIGFIGSWF